MQVEKQQGAPAATPLVLSGGLSWKAKVFIVIIGLFVACALGITAAVAKTGIVRVPLISGFVETMGTPLRVVAIPAGTPTAQETFKTQFEGAVARYARSRSEVDRHVQIRISEASIAKSLLAELPRINQGESMNIEFAQVAIEPEFAEVFATLKRGDIKNTVQAQLAISIENQKPVLAIRKISVGTVSLPGFLLGPVAGSLADASAEDALTALRSVMELKAIHLKKGMVIIDADLASGVVNGR